MLTDTSEPRALDGAEHHPHLRVCHGLLCGGRRGLPPYYFHRSGVCIECRLASVASRARPWWTPPDSAVLVRPPVVVPPRPNPVPRKTRVARALHNA